MRAFVLAITEMMAGTYRSIWVSASVIDRYGIRFVKLSTEAPIAQMLPCPRAS